MDDCPLSQGGKKAILIVFALKFMDCLSQMKKILSPVATLISAVVVGSFLLIGGVVFAERSETITEPSSFLGSYLAGRYASSKHDTIEAAMYMRRALDYEPANRHILEQTFLLELMAGHWPQASTLANKLIAIDPSHPFARLFRGVDEFKDKRYDNSQAHFTAGNEGPLGALIGRIAQAWIYSDNGKYDQAMTLLRVKSDTDWVRDYQQYHRALIADVNGKVPDAEREFARLYRKYHQMVRLVGSYVQFLARNDKKKAALKILGQHFSKSRFKHPDLEKLEAEIKAHAPILSYVTNSNEGLAEIFFSLGDRRAENGGVDDGLIFLQIARFLRKDFAAADYALGSLLYRAKKYDRAMVFLGNVKEDAPLWLDSQILRAQSLSSNGDTKAAISMLEGIYDKVGAASKAEEDGAENSDKKSVEPQYYTVKEGDTLWTVAQSAYGDGTRYKDLFMLNPELGDDAAKIFPGQKLLITKSVAQLKGSLSPEALVEESLRPGRDIDLFNALGKLYLDEKNYRAAADNYTKAINAIGRPRPVDWFYFYGRGISYERLKEWPKAEKDFKQALKLSPNRPDVLNYLGYSWVDQKLNLNEAMKLIRRAVKLKPNSGYYVDSLGWAHYQLGHYKEAVTYLEKAVALQPDDPVINDHLGDAYWRIGRKLEAKFQWKHVLGLEPEKDLLETLKNKMEFGLSDRQQAKAAIEKKTID